MSTSEELYAVLAEFSKSDGLLDAVRKVKAQGYDAIEAFTPFPVEGLAEAIGFHDRRVPVAVLVGGVLGALAGFLLQLGTNLDYPLWIGGRPLIAVPSFVLITVVVMMLFAIMAGIVTMFVLNRLPRLHHPLFDADRFHFASDDRFFLAIYPVDGFDRNAAGKLLASLNPVAIIDVDRGAGA